jgi:hypothetical protein
MNEQTLNALADALLQAIRAQTADASADDPTRLVIIEAVHLHVHTADFTQEADFAVQLTQKLQAMG